MGLIFQEGLSFSGFERNRVFMGSRDLRWRDVSSVSGADSEADSRAALVADFDDDGDPDLFVNATQRECHMLFRNDVPGGPKKPFLKLRLAGAGGPAVGAIVKLETASGKQARVLSCGTGFESQDAPEMVFGLGADPKARVVVRWPGRGVEDFGRLPAGGRFLLREGTGRAEPLQARTFAFGEPLPRGLRFRVGERLDPPTLTGLDGAPLVPRAEGKGRLLLNFWATTCLSCIKELPELDALHAGDRFRVVAVSLDPPQRSEQVRSLWKRLDLALPVGRLSEQDAERLFDLQRLAIPLSVILSADGRVERIIQGRIREGDL